MNKQGMIGGLVLWILIIWIVIATSACSSMAGNYGVFFHPINEIDQTQRLKQK